MLAVLIYLRRIIFVITAVFVLSCGASYFGTIVSHASSALVVLSLPLLIIGALNFGRTILKVYVYMTVLNVCLQCVLFWVVERLKCSCTEGGDFLHSLPMVCPTGYEQSLVIASVVIFVQFCMGFFGILVAAQLKAKIENESHFE